METESGVQSGLQVLAVLWKTGTVAAGALGPDRYLLLRTLQGASVKGPEAMLYIGAGKCREAAPKARESDLVPYAPLWLKKDKNGSPFYAGQHSDTVGILVFRNHKKEDSHPDYRVMWQPREARPRNAAADAGAASGKPAGGPDGLPF